MEDGPFGLPVLRGCGEDYRVEIQLQAMAQVLMVGAVEVDARAGWKSITVRIDEDEIDALAEHDAAVLSAIAAHDAAISAQLAQHDADIKALLLELREGQQEIIRLLLTPQGRRESGEDEFPLKPGSGRKP